MDERQADRIIALLESIKTNTRDTDIAINGIASDISKIAEDVNNIKHSITYLEWFVVMCGVFVVMYGVEASIGALWAIIKKFF